jgi:predicted O-methyltransferase YrrM
VYPLRNWVGAARTWGKPVPPPHIVKQRTLQSYSKRFGLKILVETGTYYGDMVEAMKDSFDRIYSIELGRELYEKARERFKGAKHIELICGDSSIELRNVVSRLNQPALFWLDGHYSGGDTAKGDKDTPIYEELSQILDAPDKGHVIIIDDARCFGSDPAYPRIRELKRFIQSKRSNVDIVVRDDSIRVTPKPKRYENAL